MRNKIIISVLTVLTLFLVFTLAYNKNGGKANAQAPEPELVCQSPEIPVGIAADAALVFAMQTISEAQKAVNSAVTMIILSDQLLNLPDQCQASNCSVGCSQTSNPVLCGTLAP